MRRSTKVNNLKRLTPVSCLLLDIGGVLLTDGWDHHARKRAATVFKLKLNDLEERHHQAFETFEFGKLSLQEYLNLTVFHQKRSFTRAQFQRFMFAQSTPYPRMLELFRNLKNENEFKIVAVSNEARELNAYRIRRFKLDMLIDTFVSSCFVRLRKPDANIFQLALDIAQVPIGQVVYIDNTPMFVQVAEGLGIRSILHTDFKSTCEALASCGLALNEKD